MLHIDQSRKMEHHQTFCTIARVAGALPLLAYAVMVLISQVPMLELPLLALWLPGDLAMLSTEIFRSTPMLIGSFVLLALVCCPMVAGLCCWNADPHASITATIVYGLDTVFVFLAYFLPGFGVRIPGVIQLVVHVVILALMCLGTWHAQKLCPLLDPPNDPADSLPPRPDASWLDDGPPETPDSPDSAPETTPAP